MAISCLSPLCRHGIGFTFVCALTAAQAAVTLPSLISDHMVLQKSSQTRVWGKADPGEHVSVKLANASATATADAQGNWQVRLDLSQTGHGPHSLHISASNEITLQDVLVGEVWIASGQSNMAFALKDTVEAPQELAQAEQPWLRQFRVSTSETVSKQEDFPQGRSPHKWTVASERDAGSFSAVGWHFARKLHEELGVPVGIINTSYPGTRIVGWISEEGYDADPMQQQSAEAELLRYNSYLKTREDFVRAMDAWLPAHGIEDSASNTSALSPANWEPLQLPGAVRTLQSAQGGIYWLRREIDIPPQMAGKRQRLDLGDIRGFETVYWNDRQIGQTNYRDYAGDGYARRYTVPADLLHAGKNTITLRIYAPLGMPQIKAAADELKLGSLPLGGEWQVQMQEQFNLAEGSAAQTPRPPADTGPRARFVPTLLFNGMVNPATPYTIRGALWYQGEEDAWQAWNYRRLLPLLIQDWRAQWDQGDFPFYICQLPAWGQKSSKPEESNWAEIREAQGSAAQLPNTAVATLIDTGDTANIHPADKRAAGGRLAALALNRTYGIPMTDSGPVYTGMDIDRGAITLHFNPAGSRLIAKPVPEHYSVDSERGTTTPLQRNSPQSELEGFAICGVDQQWVWAQAEIEGNTVKVWSPQVPEPVAVRYAWAAHPSGNLYNTEGFPAAPFRTDDFPVSTLKRRF